jgi:hypothetical protein
MSENNAESYNKVDRTFIAMIVLVGTAHKERSTSGGTDFVLPVQYLGSRRFHSTEEMEVAAHD